LSGSKKKATDIESSKNPSGEANQANVFDATNKMREFDGILQTSMFDGERLGYWKKSGMWGEGDVYIQDGCLIIDKGVFMTGVTWTGPIIKMNYIISLEAMRVDGNDFFCGLTFPFGEDSCSLILGGWGGQVCGLAGIDNKNADLNEATFVMQFENNRWYRIDLQITPDGIMALIDNELVVNVFTEGKVIDIRADFIFSLPLGLSTWKTTGAFRNIHCYMLR